MSELTGILTEFCYRSLGSNSWTVLMKTNIFGKSTIMGNRGNPLDVLALDEASM